MPKCILSGQVKSTFTQEQADDKYIQMTNGATTTLASSLQVSGINSIEFTEEGEDSITASNVSYSNTTSGMTSGNVQDAIDELFQSVSGGGRTLYITITGTDPNFSADYTCQQIYDAFSSGRPVYAVWDEMLLMPLQITSTLAWFTYSASNSYGEVQIQGDGTIPHVFAGYGSLEAKDIGFVSTNEHITATNLQDAFDQLLDALGM